MSKPTTNTFSAEVRDRAVWMVAAPRLLTIAIDLAEQSKEMRALHVEADTTYRFVRPGTFMARHALR
jgi:hypothetical protein